MAYMRPDGHLERRTNSGRNPHGKPTVRDWWFVKSDGCGNGYVFIGALSFPKKYLGRKLRLGVEFMEDR